eukprot:g12206.t1
MDAPALCDSILQFVGGSLPAEGSTSNVPVTYLAGGAAGERVSVVGAAADAAADAGRTGSTTASGTEQQRLQKQGLMRAFMGNKLGEFNMRGVEAGMGMVNVTSRKTGKLLNSGRRQRREEQRTPYGRRSLSRGENCKKYTQAERPQTGDAQVASANAASSQGGSTTPAQPASSAGGVVGVGVDSPPSSMTPLVEDPVGEGLPVKS